MEKNLVSAKLLKDSIEVIDSVGRKYFIPMLRIAQANRLELIENLLSGGDLVWFRSEIAAIRESLRRNEMMERFGTADFFEGRYKGDIEPGTCFVPLKYGGWVVLPANERAYNKIMEGLKIDTSEQLPSREVER